MLVVWVHILVCKHIKIVLIVDMEYLIKNMFKWFDITEEILNTEREISTPIDILT